MDHRATYSNIEQSTECRLQQRADVTMETNVLPSYSFRELYQMYWSRLTLRTLFSFRGRSSGSRLF